MGKYQVYYEKDGEQGTMIVTAKDKEDAEQIAYELLDCDTTYIQCEFEL